jgi:glycogen debranching enzyme
MATRFPRLTLLAALGVIVLSRDICAQEPSADSLRPTPINWKQSDLDLTGPSRPGSYIGVVGRRSVAMGTEQGDLEVWTWPLKLLHGFNLRFQTPLYAEPIAGKDIARRVEVTPAGTTIVYSHPAFTVRQRIFAPLHEPAIVLVLEVDAVRPIEILAEFQSDLQYAWPAALGGQYVFWDAKENAFVLSESRRQVNGFVGSPYTTSATNQPAHNVPEAPNQLRIAVGDQTTVPMPRPGEPAGRLTRVHASGIPIVMVGATAPRDSVRAIYRRVLANVSALYDERAAHAQSVTDSAMWIETPDPVLDRAVRWAAINMDEAMVCNPDLGCGLVAGYGPSGARGTRPGFGWYFGGDASINSLGMTGAGQFGLARQGLEFFTRYQNAEGKIPHEISQGAGRIRWFEDFPYAFYHADTTPYWLMAWGDYWCATGDTTAIRRVWSHIKRAYEWSRSTIDPETGLMLNSKGGLGAVEVGDLGVGVESDIYLSGVWVVALERVARMAEAVGEGRMAREARTLLAKASGSLRDRFWLPDQQMYAFALLKDGAIRPELTVWPATALSFGLMDDERGMQGATALARATLNTDWGTRSLASESKLFDPLHYNNGTVWPFVTGFAALAQYRYRNPLAGYLALSTIVRSGFTSGLGRNPEVWSGSRFEPLDTSVPHQFFGTSFILTVLTRGVLGWEPDVPRSSLRLAPQLPAEWGEMQVHGARAGGGKYELLIRKSTNELRVEIEGSGGPDTLLFEPHLPLGSRVTGLVVNGASVPFDSVPNPRDTQIRARIGLTQKVAIVVQHTTGYELIVRQPAIHRGEGSKSMRVLDMRLVGGELVIQAEAPAGSTMTISLAHDPMTIQPAEFPGEGDPIDGYVRKEFRIPVP